MYGAVLAESLTAPQKVRDGEQLACAEAALAATSHSKPLA